MSIKLGEQPQWVGLEPNVEVPDSFFDELIAEPVARSLLTRGYALVELPRDVRRNYADFALALKAFCEQSQEEKARFATMMPDSTKWSPNQFHGYSKMEGLKEQYMIRLTGKGSDLCLPGSYNGNPHFGKTAILLYEHLDLICRDCLSQVAFDLGIRQEEIDRIIDPIFKDNTQDGPDHIKADEVEPHMYRVGSNYAYPEYVSTSLLDVFHYFNSFTKADGSFDKFTNNHNSHSDSGILTVVPIADVPGLDVFDQSRQQWIALEVLAHKVLGQNFRNYAVVFWGDSHQYLTTDAEACMHRVSKCHDERYSIVFKMRTSPIATAPRYQEDYVLAAAQLKVMDKHKLTLGKNVPLIARDDIIPILSTVVVLGVLIFAGRYLYLTHK